MDSCNKFIDRSKIKRKPTRGRKSSKETTTTLVMESESREFGKKIGVFFQEGAEIFSDLAGVGKGGEKELGGSSEFIQ